MRTVPVGIRHRARPGSVTHPPDVVVVGGGAAGLAAATTVTAAGGSAVLVADGPLGGDCTWHGCVPTKSVLEAAAAGLGAAEALAHTRAVVARVARTESEEMLRGAGVEVVRSRAVLRPGAVVALADGTSLRALLGVVLATGSRPSGAAALGLQVPAGCTVTDTDGWLAAVTAHLGLGGPASATSVGSASAAPAGSASAAPAASASAASTGPPGPVIVVGGGASGVELAQALARLQVAGPHGVVLVEREGALLGGLPGAGQVVAASLASDGVRVVTGADEGVLAREAVPGSLVLRAAGREPVLDAVADGAVLTGPRGVLVDAAMRTGAQRVCAAGDVTGLLPTTHVAAATGRVAAATLLGCDVTFDATWVPRVVYTDPEVAAVGTVPTPGDPVRGATTTRSVRVPLSRNDRALTAALPGARGVWTRGGFVQVWVDGEPDPRHPEGPLLHGGRFVGALVVGPHAGELVAEVALAGRLGLDVERWCGGRTGIGAMAAQHAYPTWSWVWQSVADRLLGR